MLERFNFHTRGNSECRVCVRIPEGDWAVPPRGGERLYVFGNERHEFDRLTLLRSCGCDSRTVPSECLRNPDEFVLLIRIASVLASIALKSAVTQRSSTPLKYGTRRLMTR